MTQPDALSPQHIEKSLSGNSIGRRIIYYPCIDSTNRAARALALQGESHGWVVLADEQSEGRGRLDRIWESQAGEDILASIIVHPQLPAADSFRLTMVASIAVVLAVERVCDIVCGIKWPNDIFLNGKKLCGILSEGRCESDRMQFMVIGIGLNVNSCMTGRDALAAGAISLRDATGQRHNRSTLIIAMLEEFERLYAIESEGTGDSTQRLWEKHAMMLGHKVSIHNGNDVLRGIARGIMPDGSLIMQEATGREHIIVCGDLSLRLEQ